MKWVSAHRVSQKNPMNQFWDRYLHVCHWWLMSCGWYYSQRVPRTGWVYRNVKKPESVSDHMYRMAMMSLTITDPTVDRDRWVPYTWKSVFTPLSKRKAEKLINVPSLMCSGSLPVKRDFSLSDHVLAHRRSQGIVALSYCKVFSLQYKGPWLLLWTLVSPGA